MSKDATPIVPPRNDPKALEPYAKSKALELQGRTPGFKYEWIRRSDVEYKSRPHEIGDSVVGFLMVDGWEVVDSRQGVTQGRARDDAGRPVDTVMTNGELVLMRTTDENHAKYQVIERKRDALIDKRLAGGQRHSFGNASNFKTRTVGGHPDAMSIQQVYQGV